MMDRSGHEFDDAILELLRTGKLRAARNADGSLVTSPDDAGRQLIAFVAVREGDAPPDQDHIDEEVEAYRAEIAERTLIAIPVADPRLPSGCVEWPVVDWVTEPDGRRLPVVPDDYGPDPEQGIWGGPYATYEEDGWWRFPDGERCDDKHLARAMRRRAGISIKRWEAQSREIGAMDRPWLATQH
jgi:hypothetical protein